MCVKMAYESDSLGGVDTACMVRRNNDFQFINKGMMSLRNLIDSIRMIAFTYL